MGLPSHCSENLPRSKHSSKGPDCHGSGPAHWEAATALFVRPVLSQLRVCRELIPHACLSPCPGPSILKTVPGTVPRMAKTAFGGGHSLRGPTYHLCLLCEYMTVIPALRTQSQVTVLTSSHLGGSGLAAPSKSWALWRLGSMKGRKARFELIEHGFLKNCDLNIRFLTEGFLFCM